ncbi:MAG: hypothetical protein ACQPRJ_06200 [Solitalea-like symbiont of Acarus siro]
MKTIGKYLFLFSLLLFIGFSTWGQIIGRQESPKIGTPDYLLVKRGFGIFKLGDHINNYSEYVTRNSFYDNDRTNTIYNLIDPELLPEENGIKIKHVELVVNQGLIQSIDIFVDKEYKEALLTALKTHFGDGESGNTESAFWKSKGAKIVLSYANGYKSTDMGRAIFVHTALDEVRDDIE